MITQWMISKLEAVKDYDRVLLLDALRLLSESDSHIHGFAKSNGFTVIIASTNLVFRELFEKAVADADTQKLLIIDRAPASRRKKFSHQSAPPPFYPDLLETIPSEARIELDLRQFLIDQTGDPNWSFEANARGVAPLIARHLKAILRAHLNLRATDANRFTDNDFYTIVAYAALGVPEFAFKKPDARTYWQIGLLAHDVLESLEAFAPEITRPIKNELSKAPAPFCWFSKYPAESVLRTCYLSVILQQHFDSWNLLLANIDASLLPVTDIPPDLIKQVVPDLIKINPKQAADDIEAVENSLPASALDLLFSKHRNIHDPEFFYSVIRNEKYSALFLSLALLSAQADLISDHPASEVHRKIFDHINHNLFPSRFIRMHPCLSVCKESFNLAFEIQKRRLELKQMTKMLNVMNAGQLTFAFFGEFWNKKQVNRIEYFLSRFERLVFTGELLPCSPDNLPPFFPAMVARVRKQVQEIRFDIEDHLRHVNLRFQEMVAGQYPTWIAKDTDVRLTAQFLRRCLKPHWDPEKEKAAVFIFDGMRYDIWDELVRPMLQDRIEMIADYPASAILPTETYITRKAISANAFPDTFNTGHGEDKLLRDGLKQVFGIDENVAIISPDGAGVGETVRFRSGNLDVYIFELCDKELHKVSVKKHPDGKESPSRPLAFIYQQHIKNIIETEFMSIFKGLTPGTKVFITADHGFAPVGREQLWFDSDDLNEPFDCSYLNCTLRVPLKDLNIPPKVRDNIIGFSPEALKMPAEEDRMNKKTGQVFHKIYKSIVFPKPGFAFSRAGTPFRPDAWSHGGISMQEMMIPMVVMKIKSEDTNIFSMEPIQGPRETVEGEWIEFTLPINPKPGKLKPADELRVDVKAAYGKEHPLPDQVVYLSPNGAHVIYNFKPDTESATAEERRIGSMERTLTVKAVCQKGNQLYQKTQTCTFTVKLNSDKIIRRVPAHLGNILGLTPKSMR